MGEDNYQYDIPPEDFDWAADTWLKILENKTGDNEFLYAGGEKSLKAVIWTVFYDFHALMNDEISYLFQPSYIDGKFEKLLEDNFKEIDSLARHC